MGDRNPIRWPVHDVQQPPSPHGFFPLAKPEPEPATRADVDALRDEVRALRQALPPQSTVILTGAVVRDAMLHLHGGRAWRR